VNSTLDIEAIRVRAGALALDQSTMRDAVVALSGRTDWPLGDAIMRILADVESLAARVEELEVRCNEPDPVRAALIGVLRADGYRVDAPGMQPVITLADIDAAQSEMLGEDEPDLDQAIADNVCGFRPCPSCDKPLPPDGRCRSTYVDCQNLDAAATAIFGATSAETPAAKPTRSRSPEPPKLVAEWKPSDRDLAGYAADLVCDQAAIEQLHRDFVMATTKASPDLRLARWGGTFKTWAKAQMQLPPTAGA